MKMTPNDNSEKHLTKTFEIVKCFFETMYFLETIQF